MARGSSPSKGAARRETAVFVSDALTRLPDDCREAMIRHRLEGQTIIDGATIELKLRMVPGLHTRSYSVS